MRKTIYNLLAINLILVLMSCDTTKPNEETTSNLIDEITLSEYVEGVTLEPVSEDLEGDYKISLLFKEQIEGTNFPEYFKLCGFPEVEPLSRSSDHPIVYTSITSNPGIQRMYAESIGNIGQGSKSKGLEISCKFSLSSPGEYDKNCGKRCSSESLLGGSTLFCVCVYECEITYK